MGFTELFFMIERDNNHLSLLDTLLLYCSFFFFTHKNAAVIFYR